MNETPWAVEPLTISRKLLLVLGDCIGISRVNSARHGPDVRLEGGDYGRGTTFCRVLDGKKGKFTWLISLEVDFARDVRLDIDTVVARYPENLSLVTFSHCKCGEKEARFPVYGASGGYGGSYMYYLIYEEFWS